tara:strand:+ start:1034 stop:2287 length:1254 start_codon:yes stop_codon:yes gene_type:complete
LDYKDIRDSFNLDKYILQSDRKAMDLNLLRMKNALKAIGDPCSEIPAIHIAGTNGKGSIASFLQSSLKAMGIKAGTTTSPHLVSWCERIRVNGKIITSEELNTILKEINPKVSVFKLTPFEIIITAAFNYFAANKVEVIVLETGMGGRLDATTAHKFRPIIAISGIGMDHSEHLGDTLEKITHEKAAIITKGSDVISAKQESEVKNILELKVSEQNATINWVEPLNKDWYLGLSGNIQRQNAAVALGALKALSKYGFSIDIGKIKKGFSAASWPGRLQFVHWKGFPILLDGAHNNHAATELAKERLNWCNENTCMQWILAIQSTKDAPSIIRSLLRVNDIAWILDIPNKRSWSREKLAISCPELSNRLFHAERIEVLFNYFYNNKNWPKPFPILSGSLYFIGNLFTERIIDPKDIFF